MDRPKERPLGTTNRRKRRKKDTFGKKERLKRQLERARNEKELTSQKVTLLTKKNDLLRRSCPICFKL